MNIFNEGTAVVWLESVFMDFDTLLVKGCNIFPSQIMRDKEESADDGYKYQP